MKETATKNRGTRNALLTSAEDLFLTHGFEGVSVRQITNAADANIAAVNYHFGSKTNLYREVLGRRLDAITRDKLAILQKLDKQEPGPNLKQVIEAYTRSFFDALADPDIDRLMQTLYREMAPGALANDLVATRLIVPINQALQKSILKAGTTDDTVNTSYCVSSITGQILHFIRGREILRSIHSKNEDFTEDVIQHITQFSMRGLGSTK